MRRLMTPAMASAPYWATAPSRSTSTLRTAMPGIMPMLGPWDPLPAAGTNSEINAALCRRLPLTMMSVWSGARPRNDVERTKVSPSPEAMGALYEGARARRLSVRSAWLPTLPISSADSTSTGAVTSPAERAVRKREPTTITSSIWAAPASSSWADACVGNTAAASATAKRAFRHTWNLTDGPPQVD